MNNIKAVLWDADGVLTLPEEYFSILYARSRGMDPAVLEPFFHSAEFEAATSGKADIKPLLSEMLDLWQWEGTVDELLELWFESENIRNEPLLTYIQELRGKGIKCYVGTNQEKYRGQYMKEQMFKGEFDDIFVSSDLGVAKPDPEFFKTVIKTINVPAESIAYFDDTLAHVDAAKELGIKAYLYQSLEHVKEVLQSN